MNRITVDAAMLKKLLDSKEPVALCDEKGHLVGIFQPTEDFGPQVDDAELDRRMQEDDEGFTTAEVIQYLESL